MNISEIERKLFEMQDVCYRDFSSSLMPDVNKDRVIGVRTPELRLLAKNLARECPDVVLGMSLPEKYFEEDNLRGFVIAELKDYDRVVAELDKFLPFVDNWATCDMLRPKLFRNRRYSERLESDACRWLSDSRPFVCRFGIGMLMTHFLDDGFCERHLHLVGSVDNPHYYVRMMVAWYFATALAKQYAYAIRYIEANKLPVWTHNKSIQKAVESRRVGLEHKAYLRTLRR